MLQSSTLQFLKSLKLHNNKAWFDAHRTQYEQARADFELLVGNVLALMGKFDASITHLQPKDCTFRINRDVRFSKNKAPYKTNMAMYISAKGKKAMDCAGYYFHLEPGASFFAGGMWMPMAPQLKLIRQEIDYNLASFKKIVESKKIRETFGGLEKQDALLTRPPKGYEEDNPAIEYLKYKSFICSTPLPDDVLTQPILPKKIADLGKILYPFIGFLNEAVAQTEE